MAVSKAASIRLLLGDFRALAASVRELPWAQVGLPQRLEDLGLGYGKMEKGHPLLAQWATPPTRKALSIRVRSPVKAPSDKAKEKARWLAQG